MLSELERNKLVQDTYKCIIEITRVILGSCGDDSQRNNEWSSIQNKPHSDSPSRSWRKRNQPAILTREQNDGGGGERYPREAAVFSIRQKK